MLMDVYNKPKVNSLYNSILHKKIPELTGPNEASYFIKPQTNKLRSAVRVPGRTCYGSRFSYYSFLVVFCKRGLMFVMLLLYFLKFPAYANIILKWQYKPMVAKQTHYWGKSDPKTRSLQWESNSGSLHTRSGLEQFTGVTKPLAIIILNKVLYVTRYQLNLTHAASPHYLVYKAQHVLDTTALLNIEEWQWKYCFIRLFLSLQFVLPLSIFYSEP